MSTTLVKNFSKLLFIFTITSSTKKWESVNVSIFVTYSPSSCVRSRRSQWLATCPSAIRSWAWCANGKFQSLFLFLQEAPFSSKYSPTIPLLKSSLAAWLALASTHIVIMKNASPFMKLWTSIMNNWMKLRSVRQTWSGIWWPIGSWQRQSTWRAKSSLLTSSWCSRSDTSFSARLMMSRP